MREVIATQPPELLDAHLESLAIFPLRGVVLFPGTVLPLHIFEPRYRQMVKHAIEEEKPIAIAMPDPEGAVDAMGRPRVLPIAGVGIITHHEPLPDGRSNILLRGLARVRIRDELPVDTLYRQVRAERVDDQPSDPGTERQAIETLLGVLRGLVRVQPRLAESLQNLVSAVPLPGHLANVLGSIVLQNADERQALLGETDVPRRFDRVVGRLAELLVQDPDGGLPN